MRSSQLHMMRSIRLSVLVFGLGVGVTFAVTTGCGESTHPAAGQIHTGSAFIRVSSMGAAEVSGATITVTGPGVTVPMMASLTNSAGSWQTTLSGIPAGSDRVFTLSAKDGSGAERYRGQAAGVTVRADQVQDIEIVAQQTSGPEGFRDSAPVIDLVQTSSAEVMPGATIDLTVRAHDPDLTDTLTYAWASAGGAFSSASSASTTWTAPGTTGTYLVTVTVKDSKQETVTTSVQITVSAAPSPPPAPSSAPIPAWANVFTMVLLGGLASLELRRARS